MADDSPRYGDLDTIIDQVYGEEDTSEAVEQEDETVEVDDVNDDVEPETESEVDEAGQSEEDPGEEPIDDEDDEDSNDETELEDSETDEVEEDEGEADDLLSQLVTVKVNGEEMQVTVDQAVKGYQLASAANARFEEAAEIREQSREAVDFKESFDTLWDSDPSELVSYLVAQASDPNALVEAAILRAAALGKLSPDVAEALGITSEVSDRLAVKYERQQLESERAALEQSRTADDGPDEYGYTSDDYRSAFTEMLQASGMTEADPEAQRQFIESVLDHGDQAGIHNPYLAYASYRESEVRRQLERTERAAKAVKKVTKETKAAAGLAPRGRVQHSPTKPQINTTADAAEWALAEVENKYGSLG
jgi:hypothetical protein